jgi:hypothetical protein
MRVVTTEMSDAERGREAAQSLWRLGLGEAQVSDPLTKAFARAALAELERLQQGTAGVLREVLAGAQISAEQLNVESFHGLIEIVQNADDLGAREVRVAVPKRRNRSQLLMAHDGERVQLPHVLAMTLAFVSTKRDDPRAKGRFGIGLKTLGRLGDRLAVHCSPYDFVIAGNSVRAAPPARPIEGFFDPRTTDTLLRLDLREGFDADEFEAWFASLGAEALVFLDSVRSLRLVRLGHARARVHHRLAERGSQVAQLPGLKLDCRRTTLRDPGTRAQWHRFEVEWPLPKHYRRAYKARGEATPIAIAIPDQDDSPRYLYAGLPVAAAPDLPFSLNAQFDIDLARRGIQHEQLNDWLFARVGELAAGVALEWLRDQPARAWRAIPLKGELGEQLDPWLHERLTELTDITQTRVRRGFRLSTRNAELRLKDVVYEVESLAGLLEQHEVDGLRPKQVLLPKSARGKTDRWRRALAELGAGKPIDVAEALELLDWEEDELGPHEVQWFIKLARAALEEELGRTLWSQRSVVALGGMRIVPPMPHVEGQLLLRHPHDESLAARLGIAHVIHPAYLSRWTDAVSVRTWLEENEMLRDAPDALATLRALAARDDADGLLDVSDESLRLIRDAFLSVDPKERAELGAEIGHVIAVDVQRWSGGKRVSGKAAPAAAYLPASIEDRKDGWSKAAGKTTEIAWVHPRYEDVMRHSGRRRAGRDEPRRLAARGFFGLLGAETAPRLAEPGRVETRYGDPAAPIDPTEIAPSQRDALRGLKRHATHLKRDRISPDLLAVLRDLQRERGLRARRERARALIATLDREWARAYASSVLATAVYSYGNWHTAGTIPSTWLAFARDEPWLSSEDGERKAPTDLAVRTPATEALYGDDRSSFAYELDESEADSPAVRALGIATDPEVSEMVAQLEALRAAGGEPEELALALRYAAIGAACKRRDLMPDDLVGDLPVRKLRARFGMRRNKPGLIHAGGRWLPPSRVFLGAPIFAGRRAFVSERSAAEKLWRVLRITAPNISDSIEVLEELARGEPGETEEQVLVNTYLHLERLLDGSSSRERASLRTLPLWTGSSWQAHRPVYAVPDPELAQALAAQLAVWHLPVAASLVPALIEAVEATLLGDDSFDPVVHETAFAAGATLNRHFARATELFRDWLTRHDTRLAGSLSLQWAALANPRIAIDPNLQLELRIARRAEVRVPARAHVARDPLTFYFSVPDAAGEDDCGGRAVASLFVDGDRDKAALAWSRCWARAERGERGGVSLAEDGEDGEALSSLFEQSSRPSTIPRRPKRRAADKAKGSPAATGSEPLPSRQLKKLEDLGLKAVEVVASDGDSSSRKGRRRGLLDDTPEGRSIGEKRPTPQTAPLAYSEEEKEELALQVLQLAINGSSADLRDYRHLRGIGADALDKLRRYFEIKATYGALPDDITLTANEAERAFREGDKFFLAVVAGLEEGYETVVRVFPNPLRVLDLKPNTSVTLTGITEGRSAVQIRFPGADVRTEG